MRVFANMEGSMNDRASLRALSLLGDRPGYELEATGMRVSSLCLDPPCHGHFESAILIGQTWCAQLAATYSCGSACE